MSQQFFQVNITPQKAYDLLRENIEADLEYEEFHQIDENRWIGTLIFEKYFMRVESRVALVVLIDNLKGQTNVKAVSTGSSQSFFWKFDWGAADRFTGSVEEIIRPYLIEAE